MLDMARPSEIGDTLYVAEARTPNGGLWCDDASWDLRFARAIAEGWRDGLNRRGAEYANFTVTISVYEKVEEVPL